MENSKYRLVFTKGEEVKYISHLDFVRCFGRAFRRADIPIAYSQGFNPHPKMVFGLPLSVGVTSEWELLDIETISFIEPSLIKQLINSVLPMGIKVLEVLNYTGKSNIGAVKASCYNVSASVTTDASLKNLVNEFLSSDEIIMDKKTKSGTALVNIRPMVHSLDIVSLMDNIVNFTMELTAGSNGGLKPSLVLEALNKLDKSVGIDILKIHRTRLIL